MKKLCDLTNIIPVISKADLLSSDQVLSLKSSIHKQAKRAGVKPFLFGDPSSGEINELNASSPFAVSSAKSSDADTMDASTLMNPDYVQPLVPSELDILVQKLFDRDNVAWMRHSAAKKLAQRRPGQPYLRQYPAPNPSFAPGQSGLSGLSSSIPSLCSSDGVSLPGTSSPSYTLARITDYTLHEERKAQIHLAKWALDLQRSLQNERERYAALTRGDRAVWLTEQLKESVMDGSIVPITQAGVYGFHVPPPEKANGGFLVRTPNGQGVECHISSLSQHDPLGVVWWADDLKRRGWVIVQILGSFGVVGGLAFWLARSWGLPGRNLSEWNFHWCG